MFKLPKIFKKLLFDRIIKLERLDEKAVVLQKQTIINVWKRDFESIEPKERVFNLLCQPNANVIVNSDFKSLFKYLLESHPGLEFLQATPEF